VTRADLLTAAVLLAGCFVLALIVYCLVGRAFDHAEEWDRTTWDDVYSHPASRSEAGCGERRGRDV